MCFFCSDRPPHIVLMGLAFWLQACASMSETDGATDRSGRWCKDDEVATTLPSPGGGSDVVMIPRRICYEPPDAAIGSTTRKDGG